MGRRIFAIILLLVVISIAVVTPVLAFTPMGSHLLDSLRQANATPSPSPVLATPTAAPPPKPVLTVVGTPPALNVRAGYLLDSDTGHTLDDFQGEVPLPMASTTKIMTAVIAIQTTDLDTVITIHRDAVEEVSNNSGSTANLVVGDKLRLKDLLYGLMLPSGDDAAIAIADALGGTSDNFVHVMNIFAYRLHLFQTHYINPDGLTYYTANGQPIAGHYTTAYDLVRLAQYAMKIPMFAQIVDTQHYMLPATASRHAYAWTNTNSLLDSTSKWDYRGAVGIKTGHTIEAGYCLVFSAARAGHHLIGVVLFGADSDIRFHEAIKLLNWGFGLPLLPPKT